MSETKTAQDATTSAPPPEMLDRVNLERALVDFEIANRRVVDLTRRVTSLSAELMKVRSELSDTTLRLRQEQLETERQRTTLAEIRGSLAYRVVRNLGDGRAALRRR